MDRIEFIANTDLGIEFPDVFDQDDLDDQFLAFLAGFQASGLGFNAEYPFINAFDASRRPELSRCKALRDAFKKFICVELGVV